MGCAASTNTTSMATTGEASAFVELLGDSLLSSSGTVSTSSALSGKAVGLYFSAHWCPPCRGFTPLLSKAYTTTLKAKNVEVVFVSSDQNESAFKSYYKEMPWLALPYSARSIKNRLSEKFGVKGIPTLVLLGSDGTLITTDGRGRVMSDPKGNWVPTQPPVLSAVAPPKALAAMGPPKALAAMGKEDLGTLLGEEPLLDTERGAASRHRAQTAARRVPAPHPTALGGRVPHRRRLR